jgi:hypothetical protein
MLAALILVVAALVLFILDAARTTARFNLQAAGLACLTAYILILRLWGGHL